MELSINNNNVGRCNFLLKVEKRQLWVRPFEWLKLNFASCVVHQTRSYNMVFVDETYDMIINTQFYTNIVSACSMFYPHEGYYSRWLPWMLPGTNTVFRLGHSTSTPNKRVWRITQLAKLNFNHPSVVLTAYVFQFLIQKKTGDENLTGMGPIQ